MQSDLTTVLRISGLAPRSLASSTCYEVIKKWTKQVLHSMQPGNAKLRRQSQLPMALLRLPNALREASRDLLARLNIDTALRR